MQKRIKVFLGILVLICFSNNVKPISEDAAKWWGVGVGSATGVAVGSLVGKIVCDSFGQENIYLERDVVEEAMVMPIKYPVALGLGTLSGALSGSLVGYLVYKILLRYTPQGRFLRAKKVIDEIKHDSLINNDFINDYYLIKHVTYKFGTSWPLVLCRDHFESYTSKLQDAFELLTDAYDEAKKDRKLNSLCKKNKSLMADIENIICLIEKRMYVIVGNLDYKFQVSLYERYLEKQRQLQQDTLERDRDRKLKETKILIDASQKERNRQLLQNHQGNVNFNVNL